jgi:hypothetical protein
VNGRLLAIYLRPAARLPVQSVPRADAVAGRGLQGDHAGGGRLGLCAALRPHRRGGAFGSIRSSGLLQVGEAVSVVPS